MRRTAVQRGAWLGLLGLSTWLEAWALRGGQHEHRVTLSRGVYDVFGMETRRGKVAFSLGWFAFAAWFWGHELGRKP